MIKKTLHIVKPYLGLVARRKNICLRPWVQMYKLHHWWLRLWVQVEYQSSYFSYVFQFVWPHLAAQIKDHHCWFQLYFVTHQRMYLRSQIFAQPPPLFGRKPKKQILNQIFLKNIKILKFQLCMNINTTFVSLINPNI